MNIREADKIARRLGLTRGKGTYNGAPYWRDHLDRIVSRERLEELAEPVASIECVLGSNDMRADDEDIGTPAIDSFAREVERELTTKFPRADVTVRTVVCHSRVRVHANSPDDEDNIDTEVWETVGHVWNHGEWHKEGN